MENNSLIRQIEIMKQSLIDEGILDGQFLELGKLNSDENSNFFEDTINLYFEETKKTLATVEEELAKTHIDYNALDSNIHKLKGLCSSIGANNVEIEVDKARHFLEKRNIPGVKVELGLMKEDNEALKAKLGCYFQLVKQVRDAK